MTSYRTFQSVFMKEFSDYLDIRLQKGLSKSPVASHLFSLDEFMVRKRWNKKIITKELYDEWNEDISYLQGVTYYRVIATAIRFFEYLVELGYSCFIPRRPRYIPNRHVPYIFSKDEMERIFNAADNFYDYRILPLGPVFIMPSLLRLLYSTGLRINEALGLNNEDVIFERHIIRVTKTKNRHDRIAPVNPSLESVLRQYILYRNMLRAPFLNDPNRPFFVDLQGRRCSQKPVLYRFRKILNEAGIPVGANGYQPCIHDIRHTCCVHAMIKLAASGKDIYNTLPMLSAFMGHIVVKDTEHYVRLTQDMYPDFLKQDITVTSAIKDIIQNCKIDINYENE